MRRYRRKSTKKNRRRKRTRKRKGGQETPFQKVHRGKLLQGKIDDCKKKLLMMKKKVNQFRAESTANLEIERENVDHVLEEADKIVEDIKTMQDIIEKHYKNNNRVSELVKELSDKKLY